jgi:hypothetical protein
MTEPLVDHDPSGHVWLSASVTWMCKLCGRDVEVVEWLVVDGQTRWRWAHVRKDTT